MWSSVSHFHNSSTSITLRLLRVPAMSWRKINPELWIGCLEQLALPFGVLTSNSCHSHTKQEHVIMPWRSEKGDMHHLEDRNGSEHLLWPRSVSFASGGTSTLQFLQIMPFNSIHATILWRNTETSRRCRRRLQHKEWCGKRSVHLWADVAHTWHKPFSFRDSLSGSCEQSCGTLRQSLTIVKLSVSCLAVPHQPLCAQHLMKLMWLVSLTGLHLRGPPCPLVHLFWMFILKSDVRNRNNDKYYRYSTLKISWSIVLC